MSEVTATIEKDHYLTSIKAPSGNEIVADEPEDKGGKDEGLTPGELFCSALASCIAITLRMYADRKEWPLEKVDVHVDYDYDREKKCSNIFKKVTLYGELDEMQKNRLYAISDRCPISMTLSNPINMQSSFH